MVLHNARHERRALPVRRAKPDGTRAHQAAERLLGALELRVARVEPPPLVVVIRVVTHELTVGDEIAHDLRRGVERLADDEERSLDLRGVEDLQDRRRRADVGSLVECDRDLIRCPRAVDDAPSEPCCTDGAGAEVAGEPTDRDDESAPEGECAQPVRTGEAEAAEARHDGRDEHRDHRDAEHDRA